MLLLVKPETVIAWHRRGFRLFWTWKSRHRTGRPTVTREIRELIRTISVANPLWGAPRIHGELLKLGVTVSQSTVATYMVRCQKPPSQTWRTFLANHAHQIVAADFFVVPTATCRLLFVLVLLAHDRRRVLHVAVTKHPTAAWTAQQFRDVFPWDELPRYLLRDRDHAFEHVKTIGIQQVVTARSAPWQNAYVERFIGSVRRTALQFWHHRAIKYPCTRGSEPKTAIPNPLEYWTNAVRHTLAPESATTPDSRWSFVETMPLFTASPLS